MGCGTVEEQRPASPQKTEKKAQPVSTQDPEPKMEDYEESPEKKNVAQNPIVIQKVKTVDDKNTNPTQSEIKPVEPIKNPAPMNVLAASNVEKENLGEQKVKVIEPSKTLAEKNKNVPPPEVLQRKTSENNGPVKGNFMGENEQKKESSVIKNEEAKKENKEGNKVQMDSVEEFDL